MIIYLCGFMGCGKSTVGRLLSKELGMPFIDLDCYIEDKEGMSIPEIFEKNGERYFRKLETKALEELTSTNAIIATGGGTLVAPENNSLARKSGTIVFIDTSFMICYGRISENENRPVANGKTKTELFDLYKKRIPYYVTHSDIEVDGNDSPSEIVEEIKKMLRLK